MIRLRWIIWRLCWWIRWSRMRSYKSIRGRKIINWVRMRVERKIRGREWRGWGCFREIDKLMD
jgi:hypothetical protein